MPRLASFRSASILSGLLLTIPLSGVATADTYPSKTITMICPYSAGGGGDTATRIVAKLAGDIMGVQINVENKTGGGATIGIGATAKAKPDGYKLKGKFRIASRNGKSWPHPVIAGGRLYLRDQDELLCYDIRKGT